MAKGIIMLFFSLGLGYILCVVAKRENGVLKTVGYTLGVSILVLSFLFGLAASEIYCRMGGKMGEGKHSMMKMMKGMDRCPMMK